MDLTELVLVKVVFDGDGEVAAVGTCRFDKDSTLDLSVSVGSKDVRTLGVVGHVRVRRLCFLELLEDTF